MTASKSTKPKPIAQTEWDFSACPKDEQDYCRFYEFARHNENLKAEIAQRRQTEDWRSGLSAEHWNFYVARAKLTFFRLFSEFPDEPWLTIGPMKRAKRCKECRLLEGPFMVVSPERLEPDGGYPCIPTDVGTDTIHHVYAVEIDLTASKDAIMKSFERWIDAVHTNQEIVQEARGGVTDADLLKALGAFRLLKHFNSDWEKAAVWSQNAFDDAKPLYQNQPEWIKARTKAEKFMGKGTTHTPAASLLARLDLSKLDRRKRAIVKLHIAKDVDRKQARRLNQLTADKALDDILASLAHKTPV